MMAISCEEVIRSHLDHIQGQFACFRRGNLLWISSPYSFPDGDLVEVAIRELQNGRVVVSDFGETLRHLADLGFDPRATKQSEALLEDVLKQHNVSLSRGMILKEVGADLAGPATHDVLTACFGVAHFLVSSRQTRPQEFVEEVARLLIEKRVPFSPNHVVPSDSGRSYTVSFQIPGRIRTGLVQTLSPSRHGATNLVNATVRMWTDLENGRWKASLLDDRRFTWRVPDVAVLSHVSRVYLWTRDEDKFDHDLLETAGTTG